MQCYLLFFSYIGPLALLFSPVLDTQPRFRYHSRCSGERSMYRMLSNTPPPPLPPPPPRPRGQTQRWQESWTRLLTPLTIWICVLVFIWYGFYGDCRMVLGPNSSRLMKTTSVFVQQIQVRDDDHRGVFLYAFSHKPQLTFESNWSTSKYFIVGSYSRKGFPLWLNKGSKIKLRVEAQTSIINRLNFMIIKGERKFEILEGHFTNSLCTKVLSEPINEKEVEYIIEEDDKYYVEVINTNPRSIIMKMNLSVSSKMYDLTKAQDKCSTTNGSCVLGLLFPNTHYVIVTTPNNGDLSIWYLELSFIARVVTYIAILGFSTVIIFLILKYLGACDAENNIVVVDATIDEATETEPMMQSEKHVGYNYGTVEEDEESGGSSSCSEDLYDAKLCVICYDDQRNCFFIPCGHCATCYECAQRIMEEETKVCPICRRLIHKVRRLFKP